MHPSAAPLVLIATLLCFVHGASVSLGRCDNLRSTLPNVTVPNSLVDGSHLKICSPGVDGRSCCSAAIEDQLSIRARQQFQLKLVHYASSLEDTLSLSADQIHDQIKQMVIKSRNKTVTVFSDAYDSIVVETSDLIYRFYENIIDFIELDNNRSEESNSKVSLEKDIHIDSKVDTNKLGEADSVNIENGKMEVLTKNLNSFFSNLFPIVYKNIILNNRASQFSPDYHECLINLINNINPYNNINKLITKELIKNVKSIKILFNSIYYGIARVHQINIVIDTNLSKDCIHLLTRMNFCHRCLDVDFTGASIERGLKACGSYCVNVLNACLISNMNDINMVWNSYLQSIVTFVQAIQYGQSNVNIEDVLYSLHSRISETIMYAMQEASSIDKKVRYACGPAKYSTSSSPASTERLTGEFTTPSPSKSMRTVIWHDLDDYSLKLNEKLTELSESIERYKSFYISLSEELCEGEESKCWNGTTVGTYTKAKAPPGFSSQKYNPEMTWTPAPTVDARIGQIIDGLRHSRQIVLSQLSFTAEPESYVLPDEEGSGGGVAKNSPGGERQDYAPPPSDDEEEGDAEWRYGASGSGDGDDTRPRILEEPNPGVDSTNPSISTGNRNSTQNNKSSAPSSRSHRLLYIIPTVLSLCVRYLTSL